VSGSPILFAVPAMMILAGWWRGTRPAERRLVMGTAAAAGLLTLLALLWAEGTEAQLAKGSAYALMVLTTSTFAMLIRRRPGDDGLDEDDPALDLPSDGDDDPPPVDWDGFERDFWREVERGRRTRTPA
jgi:hypothetical protein